MVKRISGLKTLRFQNQKMIKFKSKLNIVGFVASIYTLTSKAGGLPTVPYPLTGKTVPITLGHEFSGEIVKVGKDVDDLQVGDHVAVEPLLACGKCENCRAGNYNFCNRAVSTDGAGNFLGFSEDGGMAEFANVQGVFTHKMPKDMDFELGALAEPTAVVYEAIKKSHLREGQNVAVMGAGPIGLLEAVLAKIAGANHVYIVDVSKVRLDKAKELGIEHVLDPTHDDVEKIIKQDLPNGVDITFECVGVQATFDSALKVTKRTGIIQVVALYAKPVTMNMTDDLIMQGKDVITTLCYNNSFSNVLGIIDNHKDLFKKVVTKKVSLDNALEDGIKALAADKSQVKIVIDPSL